MIINDAGTNFASEEFRHYAATMNIDIKEVPIEGDDNSDEESEEQQISKLII